MESHDSRESAWFVYDNKVYDGTKFLNDHPGGPESILIVAGQVSTSRAILHQQCKQAAAYVALMVHGTNAGPTSRHRAFFHT